MVAERFAICVRNTQDTEVKPPERASGMDQSEKAVAFGQGDRRGPAWIGPDYRAALMRTTELKNDIGYISYVIRAVCDLYWALRLLSVLSESGERITEL